MSMSNIQMNTCMMIVGFGLVACATSNLIGDENETFVADQAIVQLMPGVDIADIHLDYGTSTLKSIESRNLYLVQIPDDLNETETEDLLEVDPRIHEIELNDITSATDGHTQSFYFSVDFDSFDNQYAWERIRLADAGGQQENPVRVAVLDTGLDAAHPIFENITLLPGFDFVEHDGDPADVGDETDTDGDTEVDELVGHGTFQSGLIATIAPSVEILPIRVLDGDGQGDAFEIARGIYTAIDHGAAIINLSLGSTQQNLILEFAIEDAIEADVLVVTSVGNDGFSDPVYFPAATDATFAVASVDIADQKSFFSNFGLHVGLSAPGSGVMSSVPGGGYGQADGTSAASAFITAAAAKLMAIDNKLSAEEIADVIMDAATPIDDLNPKFAGQLGTGRLDIAAAVDLLIAPGVDGDLNDDQLVNTADLLILLIRWGSDDEEADFDEDGIVGTTDLLELLSLWS